MPSLREFAQSILVSEDIRAKLVPPCEILTDDDPGLPQRWLAPARPEALRFCRPKESPPMPSPESLTDPRRRAIAHHIMANHELQALEVMAFVVLAFPDAPKEFRQGLAGIMADEQRHTRLHLDRMEDLGLQFGDLRVNGYFWRKAQNFRCLLDYLAGMSLTFEGRNLDHTLEFERWFLKAGDERSAGVMRAIHRDEIRHVAFGLHWLRILKPPGMSDWDAYALHLQWPLRPLKSRGHQFHREPRLAAGMSEEFVDRLEKAE